MNLPTYQIPLLNLAQKAGHAILQFYHKHQAYTIHTKQDDSPVTSADMASHAILVEGLQKLTPDIPILSEEGVHPPWQERQTWKTYWLLDPLDGTSQFVKQGREFTVNIALIQNHLPIIGLLYVPITQTTYYACSEWGGAFKQQATEQPMPLHVKPWQPAQTIVLTSQREDKTRIRTLLKTIGAYQHLSMSSAWKFGYLAEGKADIVPRLGKTGEWDTAAGQCIIELAGGTLVDLQGQPFRYNTKDSLINPPFLALGDAQHLSQKIFGAM